MPIDCSPHYAKERHGRNRERFLSSFNIIVGDGEPRFAHWALFLAICGRLAGHYLKLSLGSKALYVEFIAYTQRTELLNHPFEDLMDHLASRKS